MSYLNMSGSDIADLAAEVLSTQGTFRFVARGWSMHPFLHSGDTIIVAPANTSEYKVGTVVLFRSLRGGVIAHRIVGTQPASEHGPSKVIVRPDAGDHEIAVDTDRILGRLVAVERAGKRLSLERGRHSWAGPLRVRSKLAGLMLAAPSHVPRYLAALSLPKFQRFRVYRRTIGTVLRRPTRIRVALPEDAPGLARLYRWHEVSNEPLNDEDIAEKLRQLGPIGSYVFAEFMGSPAGALVIRQFPWDKERYPDWWVFGLIVRVRYRGAGIGEGLVRTALEEAARRGAKAVNVLVERTNAPALELYRKLGFKPASMPALEQVLQEEFSSGGLNQISLTRSLA